MTKVVRTARRAAAVLVALCGLGIAAVPQMASAQAESWPNRPIRLMNGFLPGGSSDIVARLMAQHLSERLGQTVVVETRAGAGGSIATDYVVKQPGDGYTWGLLVSGHATQAVMMRKLPYDPVGDLAMISSITTYPMMVATRPDASYKTLGDVIARAKAEPGKVSYSSAGVGTGHHLLGEWINAEGGVDIVHVPFKGGTSVLTDVMTGRIDIMIETMTLALPYVKSGKLRALAVTSPQPLDYLPGVPLATQTLPGVIYESWLGIFTSPGTPPAIINRINTEMRTVLQRADVKQRLAELGGQAMPSTPEELRARVVGDITKWKRIVETRNIERQ